MNTDKLKDNVFLYGIYSSTPSAKHNIQTKLLFCQEPVLN